MEAKKRKEEVRTTLDEAERNLNLLQIRLNNSQKMNNKERLDIIDKFKVSIQQENHTNEEINELYKSIISHIVWDRNGDNYLIEVNFL